MNNSLLYLMNKISGKRNKNIDEHELSDVLLYLGSKGFNLTCVSEYCLRKNLKDYNNLCATPEGKNYINESLRKAELSKEFTITVTAYYLKTARANLKQEMHELSTNSDELEIIHMSPLPNLGHEFNKDVNGVNPHEGF